ncbi:MAG: MFS transporter [Nitrospirota bacterium]|nr:MFS transporter [Nitrospirota bacterium]
MTKHLLVLFFCLFLVMIGFGITLPIFAFYAERLAKESGASQGAAAVHVGLLTGIYAFMQFLFAPLWGRWSDRIGRKPLVLIGIAGFAIAQALFGLATSLWMFYGARIFGGVFSSAMFPAATAYVADVTTEDERSRGMAWEGTAVSLGVVFGPAFGGLLARSDLQLHMGSDHLTIPAFSVPFFAAALLALLSLPVIIRWLPESMPNSPAFTPEKQSPGRLRGLAIQLWPLLALALAVQFGLAMFEATFALHAKQMLGYGPAGVGAVFVVCGSVMAVFQGGAVGYLAPRISAGHQIAVGFVLVGMDLAVVLLARSTPLVLTIVGLQALGMALVTPNLTALASKGRQQQTGAALGLRNAANSLGQAAGAALGGLLFALNMRASYSITGALLVVMGVISGSVLREGKLERPDQEI